MADEKLPNGVYADLDQCEDDDKATERAKKMEELEHEKHELVSETAEAKERVKLNMEIEGLKTEEAKLKEKIRELEEEVVRSQEAKKDSEAAAEVTRLNKILEENEEKIENLEREVELLKQAKAESDDKVKELEGKVVLLESMLEEKVGDKGNEITVLNEEVEELEGLLADKLLEIEDLVKDKLNLKCELIDWIENTRLVESRVNQLEEHVKSSASKLRSVETDLVAGALNENNSSKNGKTKAGLNELTSLWPILAAGSTGAVAAAVYICLGKRR